MSSINFTHTQTKASTAIPIQFAYTTENDYQKDEMYDFEYENITLDEWKLFTKYTFNYSDFFNITKEIRNYSENTEIPHYIKATILTCYLVILCVGVMGNVMVPIVILKTKDMRNSTNIFLMNLSIADLMFLLICMPPSMLEVNFKLETWLLGKELCLAIPFLEQVAAHVSVLTILALSFERYYAICKPFKAGYICTKTRAVVICGLVWFIVALSTSPLLASTTFYVDYIDGSEVSICVTASNTWWLNWFFILTNVIFFIVPLGVFVVVYSFIAKNLMKTSDIIAQNNNSTNNSSDVTKYRKQVIVMLVTVVLAFFVCFLPFKLLQLSTIVSEWDEIKNILAENGFNMEELVYFCRGMVYFHSAINPILYNLISSKFREGFVNLLGINKLKCNKTFRQDMQNHDSRDTLNRITTTEF